MIQLGCCTGLPVDAQSRARVLQIRDAGFDYVEYGCQDAVRLSAADRAEVLRFTREAGIACRAMNCFLPGSLPVVGPEADPGKVKEYLDAAFPAAGEFGAEVIVFGSGAARRTPPGFPPEIVWMQLVGFLRLAEHYGARYGIDIAIEPLCRAECNTLNTLMDAYRLAADAGRPHIRLLADFYHFQRSGEDLTDILSAGTLLRHCHIANKMDRGFPREETRAEHAAFFAMLRRAGFAGGVSIEGGSASFAEDIRRAGRLLRELRDGKSC